MKKIVLFILCFFNFTINVFALDDPTLYSKNYCLYDLTDDKMIYEKNIQERTNIASLTKIMTTITAIEKINNLDDYVTITSEMLSNIKYDASLAGLKIGDKLTYKDLLYASILPSGADATQALAYSLSGSINNFVNDMNALAKKIGMESSNFVNVTGLDIDNHYSTINDLLKMLQYSLKNETFKTIYTTKSYTLSNGLVVDATVKKYNNLMKLDISRITGSKTGYTNKAGLCISSIFESNNHEFIFISTNAEFIYGNYYNLKDNLNIINFFLLLKFLFKNNTEFSLSINIFSIIYSSIHINGILISNSIFTFTYIKIITTITIILTTKLKKSLNCFIGFLYSIIDIKINDNIYEYNTPR